MKLKSIRLISSLLILLISNTIYAAGVTLNGFIQGNYSANLGRSNPDGGDFKWAEEKFQLKTNAEHDPFYLFLKTDLSYDHIDDEVDLEFREAYIDYLADNWDIRIGRQIITWGVGDMIFINDIYPKDYEAFFSGRPMEYLKIGSDAAKIGIYPSFASMELVLIPFFEPSNFPEPDRFHMFDPMPSITNRMEDEPSTSFENTEIAFRIYRDIAGFDASLYYYRGYFRQQSILPDNLAAPSILTLIYPELSVYGASAQGRALGGIFSFETGFYDSSEDRSGKNPMIPNQSIKYLVGYRQQPWEDFTAGIQYYALTMLDHDTYSRSLPPGFQREKQRQDVFTFRLTHLFMHQTLKMSFFSFWSLSDGDFMLIPEAKYNFTDHMWASIGANIFGGGEEWSQFGSLDKNDNIFTVIRYEF